MAAETPMQTPPPPRRPLLTQVAHQHLRTAVQAWRIQHSADSPRLAIDATAGNGHDTLFLAKLLGKGGEVAAFDIQRQALTNTVARLRAYTTNEAQAGNAENEAQAGNAANKLQAGSATNEVQAGNVANKAQAGNAENEVQARCAGNAISKAEVTDAEKTGAAVESPCVNIASATLAKVRLIEASHADMLARLPAYWRGAVCAITFNLGYLPGADKACVTLAESTVAALEAALQLLAPGGLLSVLCYRGHAAGADETVAIEHWLTTLPAACSHCWINASAAAPPHAPLLLHIRRTQT